MRVFVTGVILFALGSLTCALAPGLGELIAGRVLEGIGNVLMIPAAAVLATEAFAPEERGRVLSLVAALGVDPERLLASEHGNLTAVGDDDQAIHRFRAAAAKNLRDFHAELPDATVVRLEHSFRCPQRVLDALLANGEKHAGAVKVG